MKLCSGVNCMRDTTVSGLLSDDQRPSTAHYPVTRHVIDMNRIISFHPYIQCESNKYPLRFSDIFSQTVRVFRPNFTHLFHVPILAGIHIFIQLPAILTKLCHIKRDHPVHTTPHVQNVHHRPKRTLAFSDIFPNGSKFHRPITCSYLRL